PRGARHLGEPRGPRPDRGVQGRGYARSVDRPRRHGGVCRGGPRHPLGARLSLGPATLLEERRPIRSVDRGGGSLHSGVETMVSRQQKLDGARALRELIRKHRDHTEEARQLAPPVVEAMARLGLFRALVPSSAGGEEWAWPTWLQVVEELSTIDGAVGWNAGGGSTANAIVRGWVAGDVGWAVCCQEPVGLVAGAGGPMGTARPVDGGYRVSGRWQFGSGSPHACWFVAGYAVEGETPRFGPMLLIPATDVEIIDTWFVGGMRGTGSQDFAMHDVFVPTAYTLNGVDDAPLHPGPLY